MARDTEKFCVYRNRVNISS